MSDISTFTVKGVTYDIKDAVARDDIEAINVSKAEKTELMEVNQRVDEVEDDKAAKAEVDSLKSKVSSLENDVHALISAVGTPLVASTIAEMTDTDKIYVYIGEETGEETGYWYYYKDETDGWTPGALYNSQGLETDTTFSIAGAAADSKEAGKLKAQVALNNSYDILALLAKADRTHNAITFTWDSNNSICHISGTADGDAFDSFHSDHTALPVGMEQGKTYQLQYSDSTVIIDIYFWDANNSQIGSTISSKANKAVTVPANAVGFSIRFRVPSGKTVDTYVSPKLQTSKSNATLESDLHDLENEFFEYIPVDVASAWSTPNKTHGGVTYTYSDGQYTISGTVTSNPSFNNLYNNNGVLPAGITGGMLLLVKYSSVNVSLRFAWYGSGGSVLQRNIIKSETLIEVPEGAVGAIIRLEVLRGVEVDETIDYPVALDNVTADYLYYELKGFEDEIREEKELKVLVFGSSFSYSTLGYLPAIINEVAPKLNFTMGILYQSGAGLGDHITNFNESNVYTTYSEWSTQDGKWTNLADEVTAQNALGLHQWDVIVLQQNVAHSTDEYFSEIETFADLVTGYIADLTVPYPVEFILNLPQARGAENDPSLQAYTGTTTLEKSNSCYERLADFCEKADSESLIIRDVLPSGTAVQNLRNATDTSEIGTEGSGYLCDDQYSHLKNGLGPLVAGYAAAVKLLEHVGEIPKSFAIPLEPTDSWLTSTSYPAGKYVHGTCVGITDENRLLGQKCAVAAVKKPFELWSFSGE